MGITKHMQLEEMDREAMLAAARERLSTIGEWAYVDFDTVKLLMEGRFDRDWQHVLDMAWHFQRLMEAVIEAKDCDQADAAVLNLQLALALWKEHIARWEK